MSNCTGRFAEAWEYAAFFCVASLVTGVDNGPGGPVAYLTDTTIDFTRTGLQAGVGMTLWNLTKGTNGHITAVTTNTLTASGVTWSTGDLYRAVTLPANEESIIEIYLNITAADLHGVMAATGQCDCTLASWAPGLLKKLNIIEASTFYVCSCAKTLNDETRRMYFDWMNTQLELIRMGKIELCAGQTGSDFPSLDWADQSVTAFAASNIIVNDVARNS